MKPTELTPAQVAAYRIMEGFHRFAVDCIETYGPDHPVSVVARRNAQRMRLELIVGEDPDMAEVRDIVTACILARRERLATLTAK